ncbi:MAG: glycosyltransferase family 39 protein [Pyrinomonadaceae bacterium]
MSQRVEIGPAQREVVTPPLIGSRGLSVTLERSLVLVLAAMVVLGLGLRLRGLGSIGLAEDEVNKVEAVRAYAHGDFRPNAEHPMLMKSLIYLSVRAAGAWQALTREVVSDEAIVRLPNVIFGALTAVPLFLLTAAFFDRRTGLLAATLWSFGINAITYNRIAKEDTLLVFFLLFAFYFYLRAKQISGHEAKRKRRFYGLSGISFGLMMASKYFPHYFGLNALYHHYFHMRKAEEGEPPGGVHPIYYVALAVAFLVANPAVLLPQTWDYMNAYSSEQLLKHTGYFMGGQLYKNNMASTPFWGTPVYFYALFLAIKVPLSLLAAAVIGLVVSVRSWRQPGHAFVLFMLFFWIVPYSLIGAKWLRYTLSLMPFIYMIAAVGIVWLVDWCGALVWRAGAERTLQFGAVAVLLIAFVVLPAWTAYANGPHYALYTNALGAGRAGYYFPHDEFYDDGLREAIKYVCDTAPKGALLVNETPGVVRFYLEKYGRTDLQSRVLSDSSFTLTGDEPEAYVIYQKGRTYFENQEELKIARARYRLVYVVCVQGLTAAEVYSRNGNTTAQPCAAQ